jgi:RNA polymerase sigma-70 factor (ECF subfamily)
MATATPLLLAAEVRETAAVHAEHADFVWKTLQRFNVPGSDLEDVFQEVFVVVHRRLSSFDETSRMTTWLYGICRRVVADYRRRAYRRREQLQAHPTDSASAGAGVGADADVDPEQRAAHAQAQRRVAYVLDQLSLDQRAVFVMFEIEGIPCAEIAALEGVPVGTVHSRLHAARAAFAKVVRQLRAREEQRTRERCP